MPTVYIGQSDAFNIALEGLASADFVSHLVRNQRVSVSNVGPGDIAVTRSVSENRVDFTALPGTRIIRARQRAILELPPPDVARYARLNMATATRPATVVLKWIERNLGALENETQGA